MESKFTAKDMEDLKDFVENGIMSMFRRAALRALLHRLECAERMTSHGHIDWCNQSFNPCECGYEVWLKSKGES